MNRKIEANELRDSFATLSEKDIKRLRKEAKSNYIDEEQLATVAEEISTKVGRRIQLGSSYVPQSYIERNVDSQILYEEIRQCITSKQKTPLIHQHKRGDLLYRRLYEWHKFKETTETFIKPVHYAISSTTRRQTSRSTLSVVGESRLALNNTELHVAVQDKLVESHYEPESLLTGELVEPLENVFDASLLKLLIVRDLIFFFFEWADPMPFVFVMAFGLSFTDEDAEKFAQHTVVTLDRKDIMELHNETGTKEKRLVVADEPLRHMDSEDIEQEYALRSFIECITTSSVSYITSLYLKRD